VSHCRASIAKLKGEGMEITKGQCVKVTTTKDQCIRLTIDIEKAFVGKANLLDWQDKMITLQYEGEDGARS
jgi:hypothetical protein